MYSYVASSLNELRIDSEARSILRELDQLEATPENQKRRFIWELIQNAKDCARLNEKVSIIITLEKNRFIFSHNGSEFRIKDLVSLVRRASSKPFDEDQGKTGRLGTGFISTHVLNKIVEISGPLITPRGVRDFTLSINRTASTVREMRITLEEAYQKIDSFIMNNDFDRPSNLSQFEYALDPETFALASSALDDLKRNITFVLAINESIESITINGHNGSDKFYVRSKTVYKNIVRVKVPGQPISMLIRHCDPGGLVLGVNCQKSGSNDYFLVQVPGQAKIFRDFPIIGTEYFNCAPLIQSHFFLPSDLKDSIRLKKTNEMEFDSVADTNRSILLLYRDYWMGFIRELLDLQVLNRYVLAQSSLPRYSNRYSDNPWFHRNIHLPLRQFLRHQDLVKNHLSTNELYYYSRIEDCLFPDCSIDQKGFYSIASKIITKTKDCPDPTEFHEWNLILSQDYRDWGLPVRFSVDNLISMIEETSTDYIAKDEDQSIVWLNQLINWLKSNQFNGYLENRAILPSQNGILRQFKGKQVICRDDEIDESLKDILCDFGHDIRDNLLHNGITCQLTWIPVMPVDFVFIQMERLIRGIDCSNKFDNQIEAALSMGLLYSGQIDLITSKLLSILSPIYPSIQTYQINEKSFKCYQRQFHVEWIVNWLGKKIETVSNVDEMIKMFPMVKDIFDWLNDIIFILEQFKLTALLTQYSLLPLQSGKLTKVNNGIVMEDDPLSYTNQEISFKKLVNNFVKDNEGEPVDCADWLIDNRIKCKQTTIKRKSVVHLTSLLDQIFQNVFDGLIEEKSWIRLFHQIAVWCDKDYSERSQLFPRFSLHRATLTLKALGSQGSEIAAIIMDCDKEPETIKRLVSLQSTIDLLEKFDDLVSNVGETWFNSVISSKSQVDTILNMEISCKEMEQLKQLVQSINVDEIIQIAQNIRSISNCNKLKKEDRVCADDKDDKDDKDGSDEEFANSFDTNQSIWKSSIGNLVEDVLYQSFKKYSLFKIERASIGKDFVIINPRNNQRFSIQVKEVTKGQNFISLGKFHALTACVEKAAYTLCVIEKSSETIDRNYFRSRAKFITDIGQKIEEKIKMKQSIENGESICIVPRNSDFSVIIFKETWVKGHNFDSFFLTSSEYLFSS